MSTEIIRVPDIGGATDVDVIEVNVKVGDIIEVDQPIIVLETDKASMDVPSPLAGKVLSVSVAEGDQVSEGSVILDLQIMSAVAEKVESVTTAQATVTPTVEASSVAVSAEKKVVVPDIGGATDVEVIEICVAVGDDVGEGDSLIVLETDKASMDIPAPFAGKVSSIVLNVGDKVSEGCDILVLMTAASVPVKQEIATDTAVSPTVEPIVAKTVVSSGVETVVVPDIGGAVGVDVIDVAVAVGDKVNEGDSIIVLETDKASMEIPSPKTGIVKSISIKEGDKVSEGDLILELTVESHAQAKPEAPQTTTAVKSVDVAPVQQKATVAAVNSSAVLSVASKKVHAGPAVRMLARELGVPLEFVKPTGPRDRITKEDLQAYVKAAVQTAIAAPALTGSSTVVGTGIPQVPEIDFSQFGDVDIVKMSKIQKLTSFNMTRSWLNVPHVTQFDKADISDLETFRKDLKPEMDKKGIKLTPLPFLIKAAAQALVANPAFNVSLHADGESIVQKHYVHIGIAVDSPVGLVVPVLRNVDKKSVLQIAEEANDLIKKALAKQLKPADMQGGCFTISSLGAMGGTGFTPIVNTPEVGILGVSKADIEPRWNGQEFVPRTMLPLCLSYDHRAVNGADAGRFMTYLNSALSDLRRLIL